MLTHHGESPPPRHTPNRVNSKISDDDCEHVCEGSYGGRVRGRLRERLSFWREIGASSFVIRVIEFGYFLPLISIPPLMQFNNLASSFTHYSFVSDSVEKLLQTGVIEECRKEQLTVISPLGVVPKKGGKFRLILDLRFLNTFLADQKFCMEDLRVARSLFEPNFYLFTFDLKDGYYHIEIAVQHRPYLGFSWSLNSHQRFFQFACLPFGLKTAPFVFTKVMRPLVAHWHRQNIRIFMYLDDGTGGAHKEKVNCHARTVRQDLAASGLIVNKEKSNFTPRQRAQALGYVVDTVENRFMASPERVAKLQHLLQTTLASDCKVSAHTLAKLAGSISSMWMALGSVAVLQTRAIHTLIQTILCTTLSWDARACLSEEALAEARFWAANFDRFHSQPIWPRKPGIKVLGWCDASKSGWGGFIQSNQVKVARGEWPRHSAVAHSSSTEREMQAVVWTLQSMSDSLQGLSVGIHTDNLNTASILCRGSRVQRLHALALQAFDLCQANQIQLLVQWIPREQNTCADYLSRIIDRDDWQVSRRIFTELHSRWGPFSVDRFASHLSKQLPRFNSRWWNPGCEAVDAFTQDWSEENNWCVPPPSLLGNVLAFLSSTNCHAAVLIPEWPAAPWWPSWKPLGVWHQIVVDQRIFTPKPLFAHHVSLPTCVFGPAAPSFDIAAVRICTKGCCKRQF